LCWHIGFIVRAIISGGGTTPLPSLACTQLETPCGKHARHMSRVSSKATQEIAI
jgi:hypothetical protein